MKRIAVLLFLLNAFIVKADIRLPAVLSDGMVLQQQSEVKLWGWAGSAEKIYVTTSWNNRTDSTVSDNNAKWEITVQTPAAGGPHSITLKGGNTVVLKDVLIGEVWVCSGQSNMEYNYYDGIKSIKDEFPTAYNKNIRLFHIPRTTAAYPQDNCNAQWVVCDSNAIKTFSAVAYYFGKKLNKDLNVPIGLINSSWGGTPAEAWTPAAVVDADDELKNAAAKQGPNKWWPIKPGYAYNAMIAPLTNYSISGAIWYQGESNTAAPSSYSRLFSAMIEAWREQWKKEFPFYYVQIAPYAYGNKNVGALIREQQAQTLAVPNTGMVVISDLVDNVKDIHPRNKKDVGTRLANIALSETYTIKGLDAFSPVYENMETRGSRAVINFSHAGSGLSIKGKALQEIYIAGPDKVFYPAQVKVENNKLIVWSSKVKEPQSVRYSFSNAAMGNLFSKSGLPVAPFRTDSWEVDTSEVK